MSLVCDDDEYLSETDECCFPDDDGPLPPVIRNNRDMDDLLWALCCRNCLQAVDAEGFCYCTHEHRKESPKRKLEAVIDLTEKKPKIIDFLKAPKK